MATEWSSCMCDLGTKTRAVQCIQGEHTLANSECDAAKIPETLIQCDPHECVKPKRTEDSIPIWVTGDWSKCSKSCGGGKMKREIKCQINDQKVSNSKCTQATKPRKTQKCNTDKCPEWKFGLWGKCSKTCDGGKQNR